MPRASRMGNVAELSRARCDQNNSRAYPPRIELRFRLTGADDVVVKDGERKLRDMAFLMSTVSYRDDPLRYENALIDTWLERELPRPSM